MFFSQTSVQDSVSVVNTCGLEGRSVDALLYLKKLFDRSKEQYLNSLRQFLAYSHQGPDALVSRWQKSPPCHQ